jgi:hypothetical protein
MTVPSEAPLEGIDFAPGRGVTRPSPSGESFADPGALGEPTHRLYEAGTGEPRASNPRARH